MHTTPRVSASRRGPRGQVMVLAALTFLLLALTLMASFSISHAVHERIRIQSAADAHAYTAAVIQARTFNTLGYMNRAISGGIVGAMSLHAWRAIAERDISMYDAGDDAWTWILAQESARCSRPFGVLHCPHALEAFNVMNRYRSRKNQVRREIRAKDGQLTQALRDYSQMIKDVSSDEMDLVDKAGDELSSSGSILSDLADTNAPNASFKTELDDFNKSSLACAVEGSNLDGDCNPPSWGSSSGSPSSLRDRMQIMESVAMASRPSFTTGKSSARGLSGEGHQNYPSPPGDNAPTMIHDPDKMMRIQRRGHYDELGFSAQSTTVSNNRVRSNVPNAQVIVEGRHGLRWFADTSGSRSSGGEYEGVCASSDNCFVNFRMGSAGDNDWNQPNTYAAFEQDLRVLGDGNRGAWEIGEDEQGGSVQMPTTDKKFTYVSSNEAKAVAKGKTYFHQLGNWNVPPNFFDPFWRAKLHPFKKEELAGVLDEIGDSDGAEIVNNGGPYEGVTE